MDQGNFWETKSSKNHPRAPQDHGDDADPLRCWEGGGKGGRKVGFLHWMWSGFAFCPGIPKLLLQTSSATRYRAIIKAPIRENLGTQEAVFVVPNGQGVQGVSEGAHEAARGGV